MILGPFLSSWHRRAECILRTFWLCNPPALHPRKGLQTSSCPSIWLNTAWNRQRIWNESSCVALAQDPHQYPTYAGGQVLRESSQLNIVSSFLGVWGAASCVDIRFPASLCVPSPLLPSCFWHYSDPGRAVAPTCTPATKKQLWSGTTSLVQLKEKGRPA